MKILLEMLEFTYTMTLCPSPVSPTLEMPMDKAIAGEGGGVKSGETAHHRFHLGFSKYPLR